MRITVKTIQKLKAPTESGIHFVSVPDAFVSFRLIGFKLLDLNYC